MRRIICVAVQLMFFLGCADEPKFTPAVAEAVDAEADEPVTLELVVEEYAKRTSSHNEAVSVIDEALEAMGGTEAFEQARQGYVKWDTEGLPPMNAGSSTANVITAEVYFELPHRHRREMYTDPNEEHALIVTNGETTWVGTTAGNGRRLPTSPLETFHGPFTTAVIDSLTDLKKVPMRLVLLETEPADDVLVVEAYDGDRFLSECVFDKETHLLIEIFKEMPVAQPDVPFELVETVTTFSDYAAFGPIRIPTVVRVTQGSDSQLTMKLLKADFGIPLDPELFSLPE